MKKKIAIYIPAYNASRTIAQVLDRIPEEVKKEVVEIFVVDNASSDDTYMTVMDYKRRNGMDNLHIIKNERNLGYGGSQKFAYDYAIKKGFDIIVMLHGDAQYAPEFLPKILEPIRRGEADMVFGSRMSENPLKGGMPIWKFIGNRLLTWFENLVLGTQLSEFHSGYRAYNCRVLEKIPFHRCSDNYYFDTEIIVQAHIAGLRISETPIPTHYGGRSMSPSHSELLDYSIHIVISMLAYWLHKKGLRKYRIYEF